MLPPKSQSCLAQHSRGSGSATVKISWICTWIPADLLFPYLYQEDYKILAFTDIARNAFHKQRDGTDERGQLWSYGECWDQNITAGQGGDQAEGPRNTTYTVSASGQCYIVSVQGRQPPSRSSHKLSGKCYFQAFADPSSYNNGLRWTSVMSSYHTNALFELDCSC